MTQHEIYTFPVGMRIYDEDGVLQDPLTSGGGGGGGALLTNTVNLTSANILSLDTVFPELVPAPPAGKANVPVGTWLDVTVGTPYSLAGVVLWLGYSNDPLGDGTLVQIPAGNLNNAGFPLSWWTLNGGGAFPASSKNRPLVLAATGPITGGTGTAKLTTVYFTA